MCGSKRCGIFFQAEDGIRDIGVTRVQTCALPIFSIIVLPPEEPEADSKVIKTILALTNNPNRREESYRIVSRISDPENLGVAQMVGRAELRLVSVDDLIARITAQTCRQSGLSVVYTDLLDFGRDEIYFIREPRLVGMTFDEALTAYESCSVIGVRKEDGRIGLNPQAGGLISADDEILLIAEDDSAIHLSEHQVPEIDARAIRKPPSHEPGPERTLILGWNVRAPMIVIELDNYVRSGSEMTVVTPNGAIPTLRFEALRNQKVTSRVGDITDRHTLDQLEISSYDHVIVLGHPDEPDPNAADSKTLVTLLHLREIAASS